MSKYFKACLLGFGLSAAIHVAYAADDLTSALTESKWFGYGKIMGVVDDKKGGRLNQQTPGFGGKIGAETGNLHGLRLKAAWYTTQDLGLRNDNPRATDAYMFDLDKTPYSIWGEAQLIATFGKSSLISGRQEIVSPLIKSYEYRIIPNLYEAVALSNRDLPNTTLSLAYVSKMSGFDGLTTYSQFRPMSEQAYTSLMVTPAGVVDSANGETLVPSRIVGNRGVWLAGAVHETAPHSLQLWNAHAPELLNTAYVEGKTTMPLSRTLALTTEAQAYRVNAVGRFKEYLSGFGLNARYGLLGLKATLAHAPSGVSMALAANRFGGDDKTVTAFGNWGGYPEFVSMPYLFAAGSSVSAIARSKLIKLTGAVDLGKVGWPGHRLILGHARIDLDEAILPNSDLVVNSLIYLSKLSDRLSSRIAVENRQSNNARYDNDFVTVGVRYDF